MPTSLPTEIRRRVQRSLKNRDFRGALRSNTGAIDLASIMVGVIVIGVIAGVIAATVFAVIPWSQNAAAKQSLDAVRTAEGVTRVQDNRYTDMAGLTAASRIQASTKVSVSTDAAGTCYVGVSKSATGKVFYITDAGPDVKELTAATVLSCTIVGGIDLLVTGVGGPDPAAAPLPDQFAKLTAVSTSSVTQNWNYDAVSADGKKMLFSSSPGYLYTSVDGGVTLTPNLAAGSRSWGPVAVSADGTKLMAAQQFGPIYISTDSGVTWNANVSPGQGNTYSSLWTSADGTKLVAGQNVGMYVSSDSGATWSRRTPPAWPEVDRVAVSADGTHIAAVQRYVLWTSSDSGLTWTQRNGAYSPTTVAGSADGKNLIIGMNGGSYQTSTDYGATWTLRSSGWATSVAMSADGTKMGLGLASNGIQLSTDSGATWKIYSGPGLGGIALIMTPDGKTVVSVLQIQKVSVLNYGPLL